jgi:hypothetical protein
MKEQKSPATSIVPAFIGKDEMNLAEYPFSLLTHRIPPNRKGSALHVMLALRRHSRQVVVANEQLDRTDMIGELLGKRQCVADQP